MPPTSSKKTARKAPETQRATPAAASTAGHAAKPVSTLHPGVTFSASARASAAAAAAPEPPAPPPAAPSRSAGQKRPPPAAGGVRPPATAGVVPRAIPEEEIYVACREAEVTGNNSVVLQLLEGVRARRDWLCDSGARHRLGTLLTSVGTRPSTPQDSLPPPPPPTIRPSETVLAAAEHIYIYDHRAAVPKHEHG